MAYTHLTESYISFGYLGIFIIVTISIWLFYHIILRAIPFNIEKIGFFMMMFYQYFRGDLANITQLFVLYYTVRICIRILVTIRRKKYLKYKSFII